MTAAHACRLDERLTLCVSHNAVAIVKKTARNLGKPYMALRATGLTTFVAALRATAGTVLQSQFA